jgi:hypothetical protein
MPGVSYDSGNYMEAAMAPAELSYKMAVLDDTWGHLAPKKNRTYRGFIVFAIAAYGGDMVILDAHFDDLDDSPWLFDAMQDFVFKDYQQLTDGAVYKWEGTFRNYRFTGTRTVIFMPRSEA